MKDLNKSHFNDKYANTVVKEISGDKLILENRDGEKELE